MNGLSKYWTIQDEPRLYGGNEYEHHTVDVIDTLKVAFKVSICATLSIFVLGVLL